MPLAADGGPAGAVGRGDLGLDPKAWRMSGSRLRPSPPLILTGHYLLNPVFRFLANSGVPEIMTAFALGMLSSQPC